MVDAENPAEAFREGMRQSIELVLREGLEGAEAIDKLVGQVCYRAADLGFLLGQEGHRLEHYSRHLRHEKGAEYDRDYFNEPFRDGEGMARGTRKGSKRRAHGQMLTWAFGPGRGSP